MKINILKIMGVMGLSVVLAACSNEKNERSDNHGEIVMPSQSDDVKGKVLFDSAHGQTAGNADWVVDGAFSDFAEALTKENYEVTDLGFDQLLEYNKMKKYDVVVIPEANNPLKVNEQEAIEKYVKSGGSVMMISDHYNADRNFNRFDSSEVMNGYRRGAFNNPTKGMDENEKQSEQMSQVEGSDFLSEVFGLRFRYNALGNIKVDDFASISDSFGITKGIDAVSMHAGSTLAIVDPKKAKGIAYVPSLSDDDAWNHAVDQGVYNGGGVDEGPYIAISKVKDGKGAFIGDSSMIEDKTPKYKREDNGETKKTYDGFREEDNEKMTMQIIEWLNKKEADKDLASMDTSREDKTPLLNFEEPNRSSEPEREPWGTPKRGYKWYDRSSFASGSYGSEDTPSKKEQSQATHNKNTPNKTLDMPDTVARHEKFKINVHIDESKLVNQKFQLSIKNSDGREVGMFDGQAPGISKAVNPKIRNGKTEWYFKTKIANEAEDEVNVEVISGDKVIETGVLSIN